MNKIAQTKWFELQSQKFKASRFGSMTLMMTLQSCVGSVAAMIALKYQNYGALMLITAFTMASNSAFIAQVSAKWRLGLFYSSLIVSVVTAIIMLVI